MLMVKELSCGYGKKKVLSEISCSLEAGEILCIIGANGSGKSTFLHALMGLLPSEGQILLEGQALTGFSHKERAKKLALLSQYSQVDFPYTIWDTVLFGRYAHRKHCFQGNSPQELDFVQEILQSLGLWEQRDSLISQLSGGQLQRVYLARTFVQNPQMILLDEPTNHLDLKVQVDLFLQLKDWVAQEKRGVIGVFHDLNAVGHFAHKVLLLKEGRCLAYGKVEDVLSPQNLQEAYDMDVHGYLAESYGRWQKL